MKLPSKIDELTEEQLLAQMNEQQKAVKQARDAQDQSLLESHLRSKYIHFSGKDPDGRWSIERLREEIKKLQ